MGIRSVIWRTVLQPAVEAAEVEVVAEVEAKTKKNGFPLPSLADWSKMERSRPQDYARSKTNSCWTTYKIQGFCCYWRLQRTRWSWSKVFQGSGYRHSWCHYLGKIIHHSSSKRFLG